MHGDEHPGFSRRPLRMFPLFSNWCQHEEEPAGDLLEFVALSDALVLEVWCTLDRRAAAGLGRATEPSHFNAVVSQRLDLACVNAQRCRGRDHFKGPRRLRATHESHGRTYAAHLIRDPISRCRTPARCRRVCGAPRRRPPGRARRPDLHRRQMSGRGDEGARQPTVSGSGGR